MEHWALEGNLFLVRVQVTVRFQQSYHEGPIVELVKRDRIQLQGPGLYLTFTLCQGILSANIKLKRN